MKEDEDWGSAWTDQHGNVVFQMAAPRLSLTDVRRLYEVLCVRSTR